MKYALCIAIGVLLFSCGQKAWTKKGRAKGWITSEIKYDTIITDSSSIDTLLRYGVIRDTVILKENKLTVKYFYNTKDSTVYLSGECEKDTIRVERVINNIHTKESINWTYIMIAFCLGLLIAFVLYVEFKK